MKYIYILIIGLCFVTGELNGSTNKMDLVLLNMLIRDTSGLNYTSLPRSVETSLEALFAYSDGTSTNIDIAGIQSLTDFVRRECRSGKAWQSVKGNSVYGAAILTVFTNSMQDKLYLNYDPEIPDCVMFPGAIRHSDPLANAKHIVETVIRTPLKSNSWAQASYIYKEYNTPNQQSGATYAYTNRKMLVRATVGGRDTMISLSTMLGMSTVSKCGMPIGPAQDNLYYYSNSEGLTLPGFFWMKSRIYYSRSAVIHVELSSNMFAFATITWLGAGWQGLNVTRSFHIYEVLRSIVDYQHRLLNCPEASRTNIYRIARSVNAMPEKAINREYEKYCRYTEQRYNEGKGRLFSLKKPTKLRRWFDKKTLETMPLKFRKALVLQEQIRQLLGTPTWSALPDMKVPGSKN